MNEERHRALLLREPKASVRDKRAPLRRQAGQLNSFMSGVTMFTRNRTVTLSLEAFLPVILERPGGAAFGPETVTVFCVGTKVMRVDAWKGHTVAETVGYKQIQFLFSLGPWTRDLSTLASK